MYQSCVLAWIQIDFINVLCVFGVSYYTTLRYFYQWKVTGDIHIQQTKFQVVKYMQRIMEIGMLQGILDNHIQKN